MYPYSFISAKNSLKINFKAVFSLYKQFLKIYIFLVKFLSRSFLNFFVYPLVNFKNIIQLFDFLLRAHLYAVDFSYEKLLRLC